MDPETIIFASLTLGALIWNGIAGMMIYNYLKKRGEKVNFMWLKAYGPRYATRYKALTRQETGSIGVLYYHYLFSINLALVFGLITIFVHRL
ncbi:MAG: hypothetical protein AB1690_08435 [Candidatus Zixiibacteriota bacterium]|jgi:hypothetical protein